MEILAIVADNLVKVSGSIAQVCSATSLYHNQVALFKLSNLVHVESQVLSVAENHLIFHRKSHGLSEGEQVILAGLGVDARRKNFPLFISAIIDENTFKLTDPIRCASVKQGMNAHIMYAKTQPIINFISVHNRVACVELFSPGILASTVRSGAKVFIKGNKHPILNGIHKIYSGPLYRLSHIIVQNKFSVAYLKRSGAFNFKYLQTSFTVLCRGGILHALNSTKNIYPVVAEGDFLYRIHPSRFQANCTNSTEILYRVQYQFENGSFVISPSIKSEYATFRRLTLPSIQNSIAKEINGLQHVHPCQVYLQAILPSKLGNTLILHLSNGGLDIPMPKLRSVVSFQQGRHIIRAQITSTSISRIVEMVVKNNVAVIRLANALKLVSLLDRISLVSPALSGVFEISFVNFEDTKTIHIKVGNLEDGVYSKGIVVLNSWMQVSEISRVLRSSAGVHLKQNGTCLARLLQI